MDLSPHGLGAQVVLLPPDELVGLVDQPQQVGRSFFGAQLRQGTTISQVLQAIVNGFNGHGKCRIA